MTEIVVGNIMGSNGNGKDETKTATATKEEKTKVNGEDKKKDRKDKKESKTSSRKRRHSRSRSRKRSKSRKRSRSKKRSRSRKRSRSPKRKRTPSKRRRSRDQHRRSRSRERKRRRRSRSRGRRSRRSKSKTKKRQSSSSSSSSSGSSSDSDSSSAGTEKTKTKATKPTTNVETVEPSTITTQIQPNQENEAKPQSTEVSTPSTVLISAVPTATPTAAVVPATITAPPQPDSALPHVVTTTPTAAPVANSITKIEKEVAKPETAMATKNEKKEDEVKSKKSEKDTKSEKKSKDSKAEKKEKPKDRRRSKSPDRRKKSRSPRRRRRSHERRRSRERHGHSYRSSRHKRRSRSPNKRDKSPSTADGKSGGERKTASKFSDVNPLSQDFDTAKLEEEMRKRRERVEKWRMEQKTTEEQAAKKEEEDNAAPRKVWSLEDDDEDEEEEGQTETGETKTDEATENGGSEEGKVEKPPDVAAVKPVVVDTMLVVKKEPEVEADDVDPLDAFMMELTKTSKPIVKAEKTETNGDNSAGPKVSRVVGMSSSNQAVKKGVNKGELMEGNMDLMEYSSEEESESLDSAFNKFQNKQQKPKLESKIDHSKIKYDPFRKSFYVEVPELAALTQAEVDVIRCELEDVKIRGKNCPKPIQAWVQAGVSMKVLNSIKKAGYEKPTPIQAQAIPAIMAGNDLIGIAKTGSGKTMAFVLPMLRHIMDQRPLEDTEGPIAVIMTPTRELALQITKECKKFTKSLKLHTVCVYGGTGISEQIAELKRGAEIIVCTPGRMIDMLAANSGRVTNMRRCTYLVLDEADRMFDMGFEPQVMHVINSCRPDRQTVLFSATFPRQMEALARRILNKPVEVQVGGRSVVCSEVTQSVVVLAEEQKYLKLLELLGEYHEQGAVLVFVDKQERADGLLKDLMSNSYTCMALHGGIDQYDRDSIIQDFKSGVNSILIATSVAARGLDVPRLILVINYNCPNHYEDYVHRCGRTGRAGRKGWAYTFITPPQSRYAGEIIKALELSGSKVTPELEKLWLDFKAEQQAAGKKVKGNSGFSGRGFKFDETEHTLALERKQIQKAALGLGDSDDDEGGQSIDDKIESMFNSKKTVKDVSGPLGGNQPDNASGGQQAAPNQAMLDVAKKLASRINQKKNLIKEDVMKQAATALMKGGTIAAPKVSAKTIADQVAERINSKLNYIPQEKFEEEDAEKEAEEKAMNTAKHYEEELEINDFPQTCRWKVTSKDMLMQISEYSEAVITIRGQYFQQGKQPGEDERKLYLAIEASSDLAVQKAKSEITRLIKEELIRLQNSYQPINKGRYKVL